MLKNRGNLNVESRGFWQSFRLPRLTNLEFQNKKIFLHKELPDELHTLFQRKQTKGKYISKIGGSETLNKKNPMFTSDLTFFKKG